mmetsp:Transcript_22944/g.25469  ORF Transcript_22944/g.25469 Transcript_22944/m.25469 type:complete len:114 (+) Transcript_22944:180-521(+)
MVDEEFVLCESHAIMRYLFTTKYVSDHWYPKDSKKRALVDQYLDWHHTNLRVGAGHQIYQRVFGPMVGLKVNESELVSKGKILKNSLKYINNLLSQNIYLCSDTISIADLSCF